MSWWIKQRCSVDNTIQESTQSLQKSSRRCAEIEREQLSLGLFLSSLLLVCFFPKLARKLSINSQLFQVHEKMVLGTYRVNIIIIRIIHRESIQNIECHGKWKYSHSQHSKKGSRLLDHGCQYINKRYLGWAKRPEQHHTDSLAMRRQSNGFAYSCILLIFQSTMKSFNGS